MTAVLMALISALQASLKSGEQHIQRGTHIHTQTQQAPSHMSLTQQQGDDSSNTFHTQANTDEEAIICSLAILWEYVTSKQEQVFLCLRFL